MTNLEYYYPLLQGNPDYSASHSPDGKHWGISVRAGFNEYRRVCEFDTREEFIDWYYSEYTGETLDDI